MLTSTRLQQTCTRISLHTPCVSARVIHARVQETYSESLVSGAFVTTSFPIVFTTGTPVQKWSLILCLSWVQKCNTFFGFWTLGMESIRGALHRFPFAGQHRSNALQRCGARHACFAPARGARVARSPPDLARYDISQPACTGDEGILNSIIPNPLHNWQSCSSLVSDFVSVLGSEIRYTFGARFEGEN